MEPFLQYIVNNEMKGTINQCIEGENFNFLMWVMIQWRRTPPPFILLHTHIHTQKFEGRGGIY